VRIDTTAPSAPQNLSASPSTWTNTNSFTVSWTNPSDTSGIVGAYYKLDSPPTSNTDGTYVSGTNIQSISNITVSGEGSHTIYVWLRDAAGNVNYNNRSSTTLYYDPTAPSAPQNLSASPSTWTNNNSFTVSWTNPSDTSGIVGAYYKLDSPPTSNTDGTYVSGTNIQSISNITVSGDGQHPIYVWLRDAAGNVNYNNRATVTLYYDATPPTGSIVINNNDTYTTSTSVTLTLTYNDATSGVYQVRYSNDGVWDTEPWESPSPTRSWTLPSGDGTKTVYYQIKDYAGNLSITYSDSIILDTTPPTGSIVINGDATYTTSTSVTLTLSASDANGVSQMCFSNDGTNWTAWEPYATSKSWTLTSGDGTKTVYVKFKDSAGNVSSVYSDSIILDTTPPTGSIVINGDATYTTSTSVTLTLSASDANGVSQMCFSNDGTNWTAWEPYATSKSWTLTSGDGTKTVYVKFKDSAGNVSSVYSDSIILDTTPPTGSIVINGDATYTTSTSVTLTLSASDANGVSQMCFSNDNVTWTSWETYSTSKSWTLPSGDGTKTVYVKFKDSAGNVSSVYSDSIILDTTPPTGSIVINGDATYTTSTSVTLTLTYNDATSGVYQVRYSNDGVWDTEPWESPSPTRSWTLPSGDGTKTVYYQIKDYAGNLSITYSDSIILDTTPPTGSIVINGDATYTTSTSVTLTLSASDANGVSQMCFSNDGTNWTAWEPYATSKSWTLTSGDGTKTVYVKFKDSAGNVSSVYSDSIILDTTPPIGSIVINGDATYTTSTSVTLTLSASDANGVSQMCFSNDGTLLGPPGNPTPPPSLGP